MNYGDFVDHPKLVIFKDNPAKETPVISDPIPILPEPKEEPARPPRRSDADRTVAMVTGPSLTDDGTEYTGPKEQGDVISVKEGERIIDQKRQIQSVRSFADIFDQEVQSKKEEVDRLKSPIRSPQKTAKKQETSEKNGEATRPDEGQGSLKDEETAPIISPGLQSSGTMQSISSEASTSCSTETVMHWQQLEPLEHQWMMEAAKANLTALSNLLKQDISLAGKKDFITGFTALHWGAKHGKKEMIRLVADRGADVNSRSQGGYTALHIAAIHSKESVMQFLIQDYKADINIRDFSGRKPRHYLKEGASSYMQRKTDPFSNCPSSSYSTHSSRNGIGSSSSSNTAASYSTEDTPGNSFSRAMGRLSFKRPTALKRSKSEKHSTPAPKTTTPMRSPSVRRQNSKISKEIVRV